jgi:oxaloacetate decarboxylase alpha subunit
LPAPLGGTERYRVEVDGRSYAVSVSPEGVVESAGAAAPTAAPATQVTAGAGAAQTVIDAPLAGNIVRIQVKPGQAVAVGEVLLVLEAMKMETEVRASVAGKVRDVRVKEGDSVGLGAPLLSLG